MPIQWVEQLQEVPCPEPRGPDLRRQPGLRIWCDPSGPRATIMAQFHHACVDGIGAMKFLGDLLAAYGIRTADGGPIPELLPLDPTLLTGRGCLNFELPERISWPAAASGFLRESLKFLASQPRSVPFNESVPPHERVRFPCQDTFRLNSAEARTLRQQARNLGVTFNDLLLHDLFVALRIWSQRERHRPKYGQLRINMPTALPAAGVKRMPAANVLGYAFVTLPIGQCLPSDHLLQQIGRVSHAIRRWNMGTLFVRALGMVDRLPLALWLGSRAWPCVATTSFSNLGDVSRRFTARFPRRDGLPMAGNVLIKRIYGAPPTRPGTPIAFALLALAGEITITMQATPHLVHPKQGRRLLQLYEATIRGRLGQAVDVSLPAMRN